MLLKWSYTRDFDASAGNAAEHAYRANSCFDPVYALGGDQPPGFDQWSAFYKTYQVVQSNIKVEIIPRHGAETDGGVQETRLLCTVSSTADDATFSLAQMIHSRALPGTSSTIINSAGAGGNGGVRTIRQRFNLRRNFGHGPNSKTEALTSADPAEPWLFIVRIGNPFDTSVNPTKVHVMITINYVVEFKERRRDMFDT